MAVTSHKESSVGILFLTLMVSPVWGSPSCPTPPGPPRLCRRSLSECEPERTSHIGSLLLSLGPTLSSSVFWGEAATPWAAPSRTGLSRLVEMSNSCVQVAGTFHSNIDSFSQHHLYQYIDILFANVLYVFVFFSNLLWTWGRKKDALHWTSELGRTVGEFE